MCTETKTAKKVRGRIGGLAGHPRTEEEGETEGEERLSFETPGECSLVRLALRYRRTPGTTRLEGYLVLRNLELKPSAQLPIEGSRVRK